tara:strand:- start:292 stop:438 length:147 start_codon:yes stop_codon:yes gene_type:complete
MKRAISKPFKTRQSLPEKTEVSVFSGIYLIIGHALISSRLIAVTVITT